MKRLPSPLSLYPRAARYGADGSQLFNAVQAADDGAAFLYRLWTVGRPDMALFLFAQAILRAGHRVFNHGHHYARLYLRRGICVEGVVRVSDRVPKPDPHWEAPIPIPHLALRRIGCITSAGNRPMSCRVFEVSRTAGRKAETIMKRELGDAPIPSRRR